MIRPPPLAIALAPSGGQIAFAPADSSSQIEVLQLPIKGRGRQLAGNDRAGTISCLAFDATETKLASGDTDGRLCIWSLGEPKAPPIVIETSEMRTLR